MAIILYLVPLPPYHECYFKNYFPFTSFHVVAIVVGLHFEDYGGEYHCWLQVNKPIVFYIIITTVLLVVLTFTAIEAAGK